MHVCGSVFRGMNLVEAGTGQAEAGVGDLVLGIFHDYEYYFSRKTVDC